MGLWAMLGRAGADDPSREEVKELTNQFYVTLRAYVARLDKEDEERSPKAFAQVQELLAKDRKQTWNDAYQIEQLLVDLYDDRTLDVELKSRLLEASELGPATATLYVKQAEAMKTPAERRTLLARLLNDLQWRYTVNEVKRTYGKEITKTTGMVFICAILAFGAAVLLKDVLKDFFRYRDGVLLILAGLAGGWGAAFSMLASLRRRLDAAELNDLKLIRSKWILCSRPLIGAGAACILLFFLVSGIIQGSVFPKLEDPPTADASARNQSAPAIGTASPQSPPAADASTILPAPSAGQPAGVAPTPAPASPRNALSGKELALLFVWCFIAGFSEQFVPGLLAKTESRATGQPPVGPERFKPGPPEGKGDEGEEERGSSAGGKAGTKGSAAAAPVSERKSEEAGKSA